MMLRYQPTLGTAIDSPLTRYLQQSDRADPARLRPTAPVRARRGRRVARSRPRCARPVRGPVNVAGEGSVSLSRCCGSPARVPVPVPAPLFGAALGAGGAARARAAAPGGGAVAAQRPHGRLPAPDRGGRVPARARQPMPWRTSSRSCAAGASCPSDATLRHRTAVACGRARDVQDRHAAQRERARRLRLDMDADSDERRRRRRRGGRRGALSERGGGARRARLPRRCCARRRGREATCRPPWSARPERCRARRGTSRTARRGACAASTRRTSGASTRRSSRSCIRCSS